jgi:hypothetical protein
MKELRVKTEHPNVVVVTRGKDLGQETLRETTQTTGEVPTGEDGESIETITITRVILNTIGV